MGKKIRLVLALFFWILVTLLFLDFTGTIQGYFSWMAKLQFLPALLAVNVVRWQAQEEPFFLQAGQKQSPLYRFGTVCPFHNSWNCSHRLCRRSHGQSPRPGRRR